ncbi:hypothetical protein T10_10135 [Trichinella papuae]|uniref:FLYWCH-type domain-containing protein n=1 Tax=Trichinella papuae TaxID=268474 RepID=A0A0V1N9P7_9BILA|nr:hypothetical protein T10_10135 [Trichinella papuae]
MESDEIQTQRNQQKLVYRGRCYTLMRTNRNDKCWICASLAISFPIYGVRGCPGKLYTNLDATEVIHTSEHADGCRILPLISHCGTKPEAQCTTAGQGDTHDFRPGGRICGSLLSKQQQQSGAKILMYHSPTNDILIFATEADVRLLAQSNCWCGYGAFKIVPSWKDLPTYSRIFEVLHSKAEELGVQLDPAKFVISKQP